MLENKVNEDQINEDQIPELVSESRNNSPELSDTDVRKSPDEVSTEDEQETVSEGDSNETPEGETFSRSYVEKLRKENAKYRERAQRSDELAHKLHAALVKLDGRLADPEDLEFNPEHLEDGDALSAAISDLVARKPGLKAQQLAGDVGQGKRGSDPKPEVDLISIMRKLQ